jgi:hypothetical protein
MAAKPQKTKQAPSETYAARAARGRPVVAFSLSTDTSATIDHLAALWGCTRSEAVTRAVEAAAASAAKK